ncbi:Secreted protein Nis1 [Neofusicoccum parvum]|uniref:Putative signal peptide-containing protein n=1 Tax=Botryosphaeria parva (strain UCR-NP2) TaxID=1287680 RepID=R1EF66_BOTPV|nr:putative signal peptide-containing protein [Neofusicoccum parvum UCRNP2]GME49266.1 Secreted protein Nis1 [Neofusicoccum parvum]
MRTSTLLTTLAATLPSLTTARLVGLRVPATIAPGATFTATLISENYIQTVYDVAVAFGTSPAPSHPEWLGTVLASDYLGPALSNLAYSPNFTLTMPTSVAQGSEQVVYAALYSLYGASTMPTLSTFNVTAVIGEETSEEYVSSI